MEKFLILPKKKYILIKFFFIFVFYLWYLYLLELTIFNKIKWDVFLYIINKVICS